MIGWATARFTIYRGEEENASGDLVDAKTPTQFGVRLGLRPKSRSHQAANTSTPRSFSEYYGSAKAGTDLQDRDRIKNEGTGDIFLVEEVRESRSGVGRRGLKFVAHRVN